MKAVYDKHRAIIVHNRVKFKTLPLKSAIRQECLFSFLLLNIVLELSATATRKANKEI